jgi:protein-S-isoprenylcysteine O-methyltransferase Ste14
MPHDKSDHPAIIAPPPLIAGAGLVIGFLLNLLFPLPFLLDSLRWIVSGLFVLAGIALGFSALLAMRRAHTPVDPYETPSAIVSDGPYRFTRNPIYLSFALITIAVACFANGFWFILVLPITLVVIDRGVVVREEAYLERKFGEAYTSYKARVRRWI